MSSIMILDLEVENRPWYGKVASLHNPENYIVAPGWRIDRVGEDGITNVGEVQHRYFTNADDANSSDWFTIPDDCWLIVAHNAMYELSCLLCRHRAELEKFLKRGGRVYCTALGEYLVTHQQELYPSLDETAPKYGGTHKVDGVKILWENGVLTSAIDKDLLLEYLTGPSGDIDNTARVFYGQFAKLLAQGMDAMMWERCDAMLAFAYCEFFGLYVDQEVAHKNLAAQEAEIADLAAQLSTLLPEDMPAACREEFNFGSDYHLSALIYGGPVKYRHRVKYSPAQYVKADYYKFGDKLVLVSDAEQYGMAAFMVDGDPQRYKSGKNKGALKVFREDTDEEKLKWEDTAYNLPGLVNVNALPAGVREKYVGKRAEFRGTRTLCDGITPVYSTSGPALKGLKNFVPEVGLMVRLATLEKDTGTYYLREEVTAAGKVNRKGMLQFVGPDSIVHHSLNITATVTTRLSSSNP